MSLFPPEETHKGYQVNRFIHFGNDYALSTLRDTKMIKKSFLFAAEGDRHKWIFTKQITSVIAEDCTLSVGHTDKGAMEIAQMSQKISQEETFDLEIKDKDRKENSQLEGAGHEKAQRQRGNVMVRG